MAMEINPDSARWFTLLHPCFVLFIYKLQSSGMQGHCPVQHGGVREELDPV